MMTVNVGAVFPNRCPTVHRSVTRSLVCVTCIASMANRRSVEAKLRGETGRLTTGETAQ